MGNVGMTRVMTAAQRAFLDAQIALSAWRAACDAEAQVAHWLTEGRASREELADMRRRTKLAHDAHARARRQYTQVTRAIAAGVTGEGGRGAGGGDGRCR